MSLPSSSVLTARVRSLPRHLRALGAALFPTPDIDRIPSSPIAWIKLANSRLAELDQATRDRIASHGLRTGSYGLRMFLPEITAGAGRTLASLYRGGASPSAIASAVDEIIRWKTIAECAYSHRAGPYFDIAEAYIVDQWNRVIWPIIANEDFTNSLDLACGHGRNTEMLRKFSSSIDLVDVNATCIEFCRHRFGERDERCQFRYHLTDGNKLPGIADASMTFVYSWDSMVHFDRMVIRSYVSEIARVLKIGGSAFLHHSNYGSFAPNSDWTKNHGNRSDMTAQLMRDFAADAGLAIKFQRLSGLADGWGMDGLDCLTLLTKIETSTPE